MKKDSRQTYKTKSLNLLKSIKENPDMVMHVGHDGSVIVWGIHHLSSKFLRIPKVLCFF
jgi:hypothetical protein